MQLFDFDVRLWQI